jgi:hypothetical protein
VIAKGVITRRANEEQLSAQTIERDYILAHLCAEIGSIGEPRLVLSCRVTGAGAEKGPPVRTAVRTIAPPKPEKGGDGRLSAVVSVRMKSLVEGTIGNELPRPVSKGKCPGQNYGSEGWRFEFLRAR